MRCGGVNRTESELTMSLGCADFDPTPYVECDNGAPADFMEQWQAGAGHPARGEVANRAFDSAYGYEGERLAPPQLAAGTGDKVLSDEQVQQWRELGYVFVSGIWPDEVMDAAAAAAADLAPFPNPDGTAPPPLTRGGVFGNGSTQGIARPGAFPYHRPELSASKTPAQPPAAQRTLCDPSFRLGAVPNHECRCCLVLVQSRCTLVCSVQSANCSTRPWTIFG